MLAKRASGLYACGVDGFQASVARQVGKTYTLGVSIMALATLQANLFVLWTAHRTRTADETFEFMRGLCLKPGVAPYVKAVRAANGQQAITFNNGSRILFGAREGGFGRGFAGVDVEVFDEAQILGQRALDDMVPAANTSSNPLIIRIGTPPRPTDPSEPFTSFRKAALAGELADGAYVEIGADDDADVDDRRQWARANPSYPRRTPESAILRLKRQLGAESFRREGLGIWDPEVSSRAIGADVWGALLGEPQAGSRWCAAVRFSVDGATVALARAGWHAKTRSAHVELASEQGVRRMGEGVGWIVDWLMANQHRLAAIVVDGRSGAGDLVERLHAAGIPKLMIITPNTGEVITAHAMFDAAIREGSVTHLDDPELAAEADTVARRKIGSGGGFGWQAPEDMTCAGLDAVTLAHWAAKTTKRRARAQKSNGKGVMVL
ncbi:terminase [Schaalia sp. ZJ405]|uniref:terminase n=1 Tax=Schaalia sp. ZJ405 TaxID=2709403 RepID=UPI001E3E7E62|nr:terminase [Schaalia sp. ZJ405]